MTRHESYAASALAGLLAARTNLDIEGEIEAAWRYADGMEAAAARRAKQDVADQLPYDCEVTITAAAHLSYALLEGLEAATEQGIEYTNRERRLIGEVLDAYGRARDAGNSFQGRCELTHTFDEVCRFTFLPPQEEREAAE
ncbi:MAG: hypothetical protein OXQ31_22355 [Spirochaetaceae bacterium]|nr:hypothetical protein [Spirochaetaceae bacterium]